MTTGAPSPGFRVTPGEINTVRSGLRNQRTALSSIGFGRAGKPLPPPKSTGPSADLLTGRASGPTSPSQSHESPYGVFIPGPSENTQPDSPKHTQGPDTKSTNPFKKLKDISLLKKGFNPLHPKESRKRIALNKILKKLAKQEEAKQPLDLKPKEMKRLETLEKSPKSKFKDVAKATLKAIEESRVTETGGEYQNVGDVPGPTDSAPEDNYQNLGGISDSSDNDNYQNIPDF